MASVASMTTIANEMIRRFHMRASLTKGFGGVNSTVGLTDRRTILKLMLEKKSDKGGGES